MDSDVPQGYKVIADRLRHQIQVGAIRSGSLFPTERELVHEFSVSRSTVRRALKHLVDSGWAESQPNRGVAAKTGFAPNRMQVVGFVDHAPTVEPNLFFHLSSRLAQRGYHLVHVDSQAIGTDQAVEECARQGLAACVVWSKTNTPDRERIRRVQQEMPVVAVDHGLRHVDTDIVGCDTFHAAREAVRHLAACGRRRIGLTGMIDYLDTTHDRIGGYLDGMFSCGFQPQIRDMIFCNTSGLPEPDVLALERRLQDDDRPDALFIMQDHNVRGVVAALARLGLRVPDDIAFVTLGTDEPLAVDGVQVSTMAMDWSNVSEALASQVVCRLREPDLPFARVLLQTELIVRGSCGAPKDQWSSKPSMPLAHSLRPNTEVILS